MLPLEVTFEADETARLIDDWLMLLLVAKTELLDVVSELVESAGFLDDLVRELSVTETETAVLKA